MALSVAVAISWGCPPAPGLEERETEAVPLGGWPDTWRPRSTSTTGASCNPQERGRQKRRAGHGAAHGPHGRPAPRSPAGARFPPEPRVSRARASPPPRRALAPAARQHALQSGAHIRGAPQAARTDAHLSPGRRPQASQGPGAKAGTAGRASAGPRRPLPSPGPAPKRAGELAPRPGAARLTSSRSTYGPAPSGNISSTAGFISSRSPGVPGSLPAR